LHLHHEDFTGQFSKFYLIYAGTPWLADMVRFDADAAKRLGFGTVPDLKKAVARKIRDYVSNGGFLFAMCTATETLDLALAAAHATSSLLDRPTPCTPRLADGGAAPWVTYITGDHGKGTWTFFGGHDPEDQQHQIGDPPTDLSLHPHSPGYRLILNNVLFPAA